MDRDHWLALLALSVELHRLAEPQKFSKWSRVLNLDPSHLPSIHRSCISPP